MFLNDIAKHGLYVVLNITAQAELISAALQTLS